MRELAEIVEALAAEVVMADPEDLQSVNRLIELFREAADSASGAMAKIFKPSAAKAIALAEEMIVMEPSAAAESMKALSRIVHSFQTALAAGPQAASEMSPGGTDSSGSEVQSFEPSSVVDNKILSDFVSSQSAALLEMEEQILSAEKEKFQGKSFSELKCRLHTLKGEAGMLGLGDVQQVCHETESFLENGPLSGKTDTLLAVKDWLARRFEHISGEGAHPGSARNILQLLAMASGNQKENEDRKDCRAPGLTRQERVKAATPIEQKSDAPGGGRRLNIPAGDEALVVDFIQEANGHLDNADVQLLTLENNPEEQEALNAVFRSFHTIKGVAGFLDLVEIKELSHVAEDLLDHARKGNLLLTGSSMDAVFEAVDTLRGLVRDVTTALSTGEVLPVNPSLEGLLETLRGILAGRQPSRNTDRQLKTEPDKRLGEILVDSGVIKAETLNKVMAENLGHVPLGEALVINGGVPARDVAEALRAQREARKSGGWRHVRRGPG